MSGNRTPIVIAGACRTAVGKFMGKFTSLEAHDLGAEVIRECLNRSGIPADNVSEVVMGQILTAGVGQGPGRQAAIKAGVPQETPGFSVNQLCGSGLRAVAMGCQSIVNGDAEIVVAGGQESMSRARHAGMMREGVKMGDFEMVDTMIKDGLWDAFNGYHMGMTAENIAQKWQITRADQDEFAARSQQRAEKAITDGRFADEIVPVKVKIKKEEVSVDQDEFPRFGATAESLGGLKPAFKPDGTVTPGNASGLNDGAAAMVVMREDEAERRGAKPMGRIVSWASAGVDPALMGTGPIPATRKALEKAGWQIGDLDLVESNEAFAAQSCCVIKELGLDPEIVNVNGGAIALGHPIGASGARVLVTLLYEMEKRDVKRGLATLCIGGGMGIAMCIERSAA